MSVVPPVVVSDLMILRGGRPVIQEASFVATTGVTALLGPNGAGKSSLLGAITGQFLLEAGHVSWDGERVDGRRSGRFLSNLGWLPQELSFPGRMRVKAVVEYAAWLKKIPLEATNESVHRAMAETDSLRLADRRVGSLSGGEQRRAALAAAIVGSPQTLLLDEPTVGLDPMQREDFHTRVRNLAPSTVIVLATHLLEDVAAVATHVVVLDSGRVRFDGSIPEFVNNQPPSPDTLREALGRHLNARPT